MLAAVDMALSVWGGLFYRFADCLHFWKRVNSIQMKHILFVHKAVLRTKVLREKAEVVILWEIMKVLKWGKVLSVFVPACMWM